MPQRLHNYIAEEVLDYTKRRDVFQAYTEAYHLNQTHELTHKLVSLVHIVYLDPDSLCIAPQGNLNNQMQMQGPVGALGHLGDNSILLGDNGPPASYSLEVGHTQEAHDFQMAKNHNLETDLSSQQERSLGKEVSHNKGPRGIDSCDMDDLKGKKMEALKCYSCLVVQPEAERECPHNDIQDSVDHHMDTRPGVNMGLEIEKEPDVAPGIVGHVPGKAELAAVPVSCIVREVKPAGTSLCGVPS